MSMKKMFCVVILLLATTALLAQETKLVAPDTASGSPAGGWGRLQIVGINGKYAVYLNGKGPDFFVGHVGEISKRKLILAPGLQHVILVDPATDQQVYSGYVQIKPNKRAILHVDQSDTAYKDWPEGANLQSPPPYQATGTYVDNSAVTPVSAKFEILPGNSIDCGQPARLVWTTANSGTTLMKVNGKAINGGPVPNVGELVVDPRVDTTYMLESFGPGGVYTTTQTLNVRNDPPVITRFEVTPSGRYHRVGDNVLDPGDLTMRWETTNANSVVISPIGKMTSTSGEAPVKFVPGMSGYGPFRESRDYTITATSPCGVTKTMTASVQVDGSIDPEVVAEVLPPVLPKTASPLPLIGLLGLGSLLSGLALKRFRKD